MSGWAVLFWLIVAFGCLFPLKRWINIHVHGVGLLLTNSPHVAIWFYWVLFLPGTFLHEVSHWLTAVLLRVPIKSFRLWPQPKKNGHLQMGSVEILVSDPFRHGVIGLAPLIFGSLAVFLIGQGWLGLSNVALALRSGEADQFFAAIGNVLAVPMFGCGSISFLPSPTRCCLVPRTVKHGGVWRSIWGWRWRWSSPSM